MTSVCFSPGTLIPKPALKPWGRGVGREVGGALLDKDEWEKINSIIAFVLGKEMRLARFFLN